MAEDEEEPQEQPREEDDTQELVNKLRELEEQGLIGGDLAQQLLAKGISTRAATQAWKQHLEDFPEHEHEEGLIGQLQEDEDLESRIGEQETRKQANPIYQAANDLEELSTADIYDTLEQAQTYIAQRGGVTQNEYEALNSFEQELQRRDEQEGYAASSRVQAVEDIRKIGKLRIGDTYLNDN